MKIHIKLVWLPLLKTPQTTGKWGLHVRKLNSIYIYEAIQNVESFSPKSRVSRNDHVSKSNCTREQGLVNKLSLKLQKTLDINFKAYYSSDDMDINKSSRKKECSKTANKTYLLAFLGKCWLLIIHLNWHRYFYTLGSLFQQLVNGDGMGCWIFNGFFEVHFLFLSGERMERILGYVKHSTFILPIFIEHYIWWRVFIGYGWRLTSIQGTGMWLQSRRKGSCLQKQPLEVRADLWKVCKDSQVESVVRKESRIGVKWEERQKDEEMSMQWKW